MSFFKKINSQIIVFFKRIDLLYFYLYYFYIKNHRISRDKFNLIKPNYNFNIIDAYNWFILKDKSYCLIPTYPSSGWNFLSNVLNYYFNKEKFKKNFTYTKNNSSKVLFKHNLDSFVNLRGAANLKSEKIFDLYLLHTHSNLSDIPYFKNKLDYSDKIIFLIRDPFSTLYSYGKKIGLSKKTFNWKHLQSYVNFYNSYYKFLFNTKSLIVYSDNLIHKDHFDEFKRILNYLLQNQKKNIDETLLKESIEFFSFKNELSRADEKLKKSFFKGLKNYKSYFSSTEVKTINDYLKKNIHPDIYNLIFKLK